VTPKEYFERLKMESAAHLLKYTNATIIDIAFEFGFNNHETVSRAFKRYFGSSPKQYRRNEYQEKTHKDKSYVKDSDLEDIEISAPVVQVFNDTNVAYIRHIGDYKRVDKTWIKLVKWGLIHNILNKDTKLFGIYYDDPDITKENHLRFDACFEIQDFEAMYKELSHRKIEGGKYLVFRCTCELKRLSEVYDIIYGDYIFKRNIELEDRPIIEIYVTSPAFKRQKKYITDICVPIK
jgi:AraC family transcriptional regulator